MEKLVVREGLAKGKEVALKGEAVVLGRGSACPVPLGDSGVSREHSKIVRENGGWVVEDLGSRNGTRLNGKPIVKREKLSPGDRIQVGGAILTYETDEAPKTKPEVRFDSLEAVKALRDARDRIVSEVQKVIIGQRVVIEQVLISLFSRGHCLLVGVPGLAKTLMVRTLASALDLEFKRIQFTPDLMPSDITGTDVLEEDPETKERNYRFVRGPIFTNLLLADEINRTPPKTQAALLEAMQEYRVTASGSTYDLAQPFFVLATQNPIEQEGTYPLPEAQLDRFMFNVRVDYPTKSEEVEIVRATTSDIEHTPKPVLTAKNIVELQKLVRKVPVSEHVTTYATTLVRSTRPTSKLALPETEEAPKFVNDYVAWGAGPRAAQCLVLGAKARAILDGRVNVSCKDVQAVAEIVMRHRIFTNFNADSDGVTPEDIIKRLMKEVPEPGESAAKK